ncbi:MAG TPA: hypothetical protein VK783_00110 [Bacteroidia bacterium]|jgi:hypothetical protein|nr:hypothetical protein [Bacteroidia bacterium]
MAIQVVTIGVQELLEIINNERAGAYSSGYIKARKELEAVKAEPKFSELLKGVKELKNYLEYKGYWRGSINTLNKVAPQLLEEGDRNRHSLMFRCGCIDHAFKNGFRFQAWRKKIKQ